MTDDRAAVPLDGNSCSPAPPTPPREEMGMRSIPQSTCRAMLTAEKDGIRIGSAGAKGLGAFATKAYQEGLPVGCNEGEILTRRDLDARLSCSREHLIILHMILKPPLCAASRYPHTDPIPSDVEPPRHMIPLASDIAWREDRLRRGVGLSGDYIFAAEDL